MNKNKILSGLLLATSSQLLCATALAQQLEEVIVTAKIRAEGLQDVSVSVTALSGDVMNEQGMGKVEDFVAYIPNFSFSETAIGTTMYIRGIGSGINQGFEQSVGMYSDGIYYGRAQLTRAPIFDMERVEVLRGPQTTLFGNNSIGGALSFHTKKPGDEPEISGSILYEPNHGETETTLVFSGPLTDRLGARFSYRNYQMDGYLENKTLNRDEPQRDFETGRINLQFEATDNFSAGLKLEHSTFDTQGRQIRVFQSAPSVGYGASAQNYATPNNVSGQDLNEILSAFPSVGGATSANPNDKDSRYSNGDLSENTTNNATVTLNWALENGYQLTSILGYLDYQYDEVCDCDFTAAAIVPLESSEEFDQQSIEMRIVSPGGETFDFIGGIYLQQDNLRFEDALYALPEPSGFFDLLNGIPLTAGGASVLVNKSVPRDFEQENQNQSVFGEVTWNLQDDLRLIVGARHTHTKKEASRSLTFSEFDGSAITDETNQDALDIAYGILFKAFRHDLEGNREEQRTSYEITAEWDINDDTLFYSSYKNGFKPGGFDVRSNAPPNIEQVIGNPLAFSKGGSFEFDDEQIKAFEMGAKFSFDRRVELNVAYYYTEISDLQVSLFDGALGFNVSNAAEAVSQGLEFDGRWSIDENWLLSGSIGFMDFEFKDYENGLCTGSEQLNAAQTGFGANGKPVSQGTDCEADFSGKTNQYVADFSGSISIAYEKDITDQLMFRSSLDMVFSDDYSPAQNLDAVIQQDAFQKFNMRLAIADIDGKWEIALLGRNITDEEIISYANDVPLSTSQFGSATYYGVYERPASWALQARYNFL